ncbi:hypothetical protein ACFVAV_23375 [Nocardia sp. NPDC057663]|uniref:hypothetical protein n=1 Tax=Nocardia sp. NPDC057663 TaxID=3346201 RepID=UPI00367073BC
MVDLSKAEPADRGIAWVVKDPLFQLFMVGQTYGRETAFRLLRNDLDAFVIACVPLPPVTARCRNGRTWEVVRAHPGH